jgi:tetratricopeptide (TPR) repeat protein
LILVALLLGREYEERNDFVQAIRCYESFCPSLTELAEACPRSILINNGLNAIYSSLGRMKRGRGQFLDALQLLEKVQVNYEKILRAFPYTSRLQGEVINCKALLGDTYDAAGAGAEGLLGLPQAPISLEAGVLWAATKTQALRTREQVCEEGEKLVAENPAYVMYRSYLGWCWHKLGETRCQLWRPVAAAEAYENALKHQQAAFDEAPHLALSRERLGQNYVRLARIKRRLDRGEEVKAAALEGQRRALFNPDQFYDVACELALCSSLGQDPNPDTNAMQTEHAHPPYADLAMEMLHQARALGFRNLERLTRDRDLDSLRDREDFQKLLAELQAKVEVEGN